MTESLRRQLLIFSARTQNAVSAMEEKTIIFFLFFAAAVFSRLSGGEEVSTYIVHMDLSAMPKAFSGQRAWFSSALSTDSLVYIYEHAMHGYAARLTEAQLSELKKSPGFVSCSKDAVLSPDTTHTVDFLGLNRASGLWPAAKYGADVIIGVVDSGVWPESASFRDDGFGPAPSRWRGVCEEGDDFNRSSCNGKLIGARFFNRGYLAGNPENNPKANSPRDTAGHGTHTASTAAGNYVGGAGFFGYASGTARGVAPLARVAVYKVLWEHGAFSSDIIAGIDSAISDGVDVISLSLGLDDVPLYEDPVAIATFSAVEKGIFVATSAGNRGPSLGFLHNGAPWQLTVGGSTVDRVFSGDVVLGNGVVISGASLYPSPSRSPLRKRSLVSVRDCRESLILDQVKDSIVVCQADETLDAVIDTAAVARVAGGIFISANPLIENDLHFSFPAAIIRPEQGGALLNYIATNKSPTASLRFRRTSVSKSAAPAVPAYTSRGPGTSCRGVLKPDLVAPGSLVLASWPQKVLVGFANDQTLFSPFNILSGSSMACPHAAGVAALIHAAHPDWSPAAIRSAMMTTANPLDNSKEAIKDLADMGFPATPLAMGSGHVSPNRALDPGLVYDAGPVDYVSFLCGLNYTKEQIYAVTRSENLDCKSASVDLNYPSFIAILEAWGSSVWKFRRAVTNVADGGWTYRARVMPMKGFAISAAPEVLVFKDKGETQRFELTVEALVGFKPKLVHHGALSWEDDGGKHTVRSPIVVTTFVHGRK